MRKAVVLLSGGIDSMVCAGIAKENWGYEIYAVSFNYGQRHLIELKAASELAEYFNVVEHKIINIAPLLAITNEQPYVPARNTIFLAHALGYAEIVDAKSLIAGINAEDSYFPDCSPQFFHAFNSLSHVALKKKVSFEAPLLSLTKKEIIKKAIELKLPLEKTITCYDGNNCGVCPACKTRLNAFKELGIKDPLTYYGINNI